MASEALDLASMMAWLGWVPQRTAGVPAMYGMYRRRVFFSDRERATVRLQQAVNDRTSGVLVPGATIRNISCSTYPEAEWQ